MYYLTALLSDCSEVELASGTLAFCLGCQSGEIDRELQNRQGVVAFIIDQCCGPSRYVYEL